MTRDTPRQTWPEQSSHVSLPRWRTVLPSVLLEGCSLLCTEEQGRLCVNSITPTISAKPGSEGKSVTLDLVSQGNCTSRQWKMPLRWKLSNQTQIPHLLNRHVLRRYFTCHIWNSIILPEITWVINYLKFQQRDFILTIPTYCWGLPTALSIWGIASFFFKCHFKFKDILTGTLASNFTV